MQAMKVVRSQRFSSRSSTMSPLSLLLLSLCLCGSAVNLSCGSKPTDLRTLVPAETLVYLETNDLAAALQPIVDSKPFTEVAKSKPDFSALKGVQLAVAVTGFETSEEKLTDERSVGRVQPRFVAVADTHAWNFQAVGFAEKKLGSFVEKIYDSPPTLDKTDKNGGKYFTWTAKDGRKTYALVIDAVIYFGNDETAIDKCLAVKRGEADSILKTGKILPAVPGTLASGYVSTDGIAQIANIVGLKFASEAGENSEVQSAIAGILPQLIRNSVTDITWTAVKTEQGIEDKYQITMPSEQAAVLKETLVPGVQNEPKKTIAFIPPDAIAVTRYNLKNPQIAWRSLLLVTGKNMDPLNAKILTAFSEGLLEAYGIADPETFLGAVDSEIWTVGFDTEGEQSTVVVPFKSDADLSKLKTSVVEIDFSKPIEAALGGGFWTSEDKETTFLLSGGASGNRFLILGDSDSVKKCREANFSYLNKEGSLQYKGFYQTFAGNSNAAAITYGTDKTSTLAIIDLIAREGHGDTQAVSTYLTETRFTKTGIDRRTTSDFGLIGSIIAHLAQD